MRLDRMREPSSWWLSDGFVEDVKSGLHKMGATCDQDLYDWLYASRPQAFHILPRRFNLQLCGFCPKVTQSSVNSTSNLWLGAPLQVVVIHGNCDNGELKWKELMYGALATLRANKLRISAKQTTDGKRVVFDQGGMVASSWWGGPEDGPACATFADDAAGTWDRGACRLMRAAFAHAPVGMG